MLAGISIIITGVIVILSLLTAEETLLAMPQRHGNEVKIFWIQHADFSTSLRYHLDTMGNRVKSIWKIN